MPAVFISYRRADSASAAGRLDDQLVARFGRERVFKDVDSIPPGVDFERYIEDAIRRSHVALVIIGPRWINASAGLFRRRLDDPADFVRVEIETALRLGVPIIPLLVENATMPNAARLPASLRPLASLNALPVRPDPDFHRDLERVLPAVERLLAGPPPTPPADRSEPAPPAPITSPAPASTTSQAPQPPARSETREPVPTSERLDKPDTPATSPAAPPLSPQGEGAGGEATHPRPVIALAKRLGVKPSHRPAPGALVATISALALIAVAATLLFYGQQPSPLAALFTDPGATHTVNSATATYEAYVQGSFATATAQQRQLAVEYKADGVGPCDKNTNEHYSTDNHAYWFWTQDSPPVVTCAGNIAKVTGEGLLAFDGRSAGFPAAFTATLTLSFHTAGNGYSRVYIGVGAVGAADATAIYLDDKGNWSLEGSSKQSGRIQASGPLHLLVTVKTTTLTISVNGRTLLGPTRHSGMVTSISIQGNTIEVGGWLGASNFDLKPTTP